MMTAVLSTLDVCQMADVTYRQIDYWVRVGLIEPSIRQAKGSGTWRAFSADDVLAVRVVKVLVANHLDHDVIRAALRLDLQTQGYLWVQGDVVGIGSSWDLLDALAHVRATLILNLATLRAGLPSRG